MNLKRVVIRVTFATAIATGGVVSLAASQAGAHQSHNPGTGSPHHPGKKPRQLPPWLTVMQPWFDVPGGTDDWASTPSIEELCNRRTGDAIYFERYNGTLTVRPNGCDPKTGRAVPYTPLSASTPSSTTASGKQVGG